MNLVTKSSKKTQQLIKFLLTGVLQMIKNKISIFDPVYKLELSMRTINCLKGLGIKSIAELVQYSEKELLRTPNFGRKSLNEIKKELSMMGLGFGMNLTKVKLAFAEGQTRLIEELTAEHKECKLRCQEIEKKIMELLGSHCVGAV